MTHKIQTKTISQTQRALQEWSALL